MKPDLIDKIQMIPPTPGVYKFLNEKGDIIYIGKAINLKSRVSSYFTSNHADRPRIIHMIPLITDIDFTVTDNEIEALVLESALVKQFLPLYNSDLKDDKSYAWLYINTKDEYPTVKIIRTIKKGEYNRGKLFGPYPSGRSIKRVFNYVRKIYPFCTSKDPTKPCFYSRIGLCPGPNATKEEYNANIQGIIDFLKGNNQSHLKYLEAKMLEYSTNSEYEKAAEIRDKIADLKYLGSEIKFTYFNSEDEYIDDRGQRAKTQVKKIASILGLEKLVRIECYDISNIQGKLAYGSMVVSVDGTPTNSQYRIFRIKTVYVPNDPLMLKEVLRRRFAHIGKDKDESLNQKPDLILIDGGKGQLSVIKEEIPSDIFTLGITKGRRYKRKGGRLKDEFIRYSNEEVVPVNLGKYTQVLSILRDEAHRFAILHHRKLRKFVQKKSILDDVKGLGPISKRKLLREFGSVSELKKLTSDQLYTVLKNKVTVENLLKALHGKQH